MFYGGLSASRELHNGMLRNIMACPMSFFETTPVGRIVTRFSSDIDVVDWFADTLKQFVECSFAFVIVPVAICFTIPWFLITTLPLLGLFILLDVSSGKSFYIHCYLQQFNHKRCFEKILTLDK